VDIQINYTTYPYDQSKKEMLDAISNKSQVDLVSLDQIWLGEFVERGLLTDITDRVNNWGRISDLYESNLDGTVYNDRIYGILERVFKSILSVILVSTRILIHCRTRGNIRG
jgi:multiple sugar transport system substrate-binding protein